MKEKETKLLDTHKEVDNFIITASIMLMASFVVMISISSPSNALLCYAVVISFLCLTLSLLQMLWHKVRWQYRVCFFENKKDEIIHEYAKEIRKCSMESELANAFRRIAKDCKHSTTATSFNCDEALVESDKLEDKVSYKIILSFVKNMAGEMQEASVKFFKKPLNERLPRTKFVMDVISKNMRYPLFLIGVIFFFISIFLNMTTK